jgi:hypothetical protein
LILERGKNDRYEAPSDVGQKALKSPGIARNN